MELCKARCQLSGRPSIRTASTSRSRSGSRARYWTCAYAIDHKADYDFNVFYKRYEDFKDYEYHWIGKWHDIRDARMQYSWQWITHPEDVYGTQPSFATRTVTRTIETDVQVPRWRSDTVVQTQTVLTTERIEQKPGSFASAEFANESFRAGDGVTLLAGRDVSLSGLTRATGATSTVTVNAERDVLLKGGVPEGRKKDASAVADLRAGQTLESAGGKRYVDLQKDAILKADDNDAATKTDAIKLLGRATGATSAAMPSAAIEIYLWSDGNVEMKAKLDSGHLIDVRRGARPHRHWQRDHRHRSRPLHAGAAKSSSGRQHGRQPAA
jgi:hypothetical protein